MLSIMLINYLSLSVRDSFFLRNKDLTPYSGSCSTKYIYLKSSFRLITSQILYYEFEKYILRLYHLYYKEQWNSQTYHTSQMAVCRASKQLPPHERPRGMENTKPNY